MIISAPRAHVLSCNMQRSRSHGCRRKSLLVHLRSTTRPHKIEGEWLLFHSGQDKTLATNRPICSHRAPFQPQLLLFYLVRVKVFALSFVAGRTPCPMCMDPKVAEIHGNSGFPYFRVGTAVAESREISGCRGCNTYTRVFCPDSLLLEEKKSGM